MSDATIVERRSLSLVIRDALEACESPDPNSVVDAVIALIPAKDYPAYLREAILARVSSEVSVLRSRNVPAPVRSGLSTKQALIRDEYWPAFLRQRVLVAGVWMFLSDATADDLRLVAEQREVQARELMVRAEQFRSLAELMRRSHVRTLADLDPVKGSELMRGAA